MRLKRKFILGAICSLFATIAFSLAVNYFTGTEKPHYRTRILLVGIIFYIVRIVTSSIDSKEENYYKKNIDHYLNVEDAKNGSVLEKEKIKHKTAELERKKKELDILEVDRKLQS